MTRLVPLFIPGVPEQRTQMLFHEKQSRKDELRSQVLVGTFPLEA